MSNPKVYKQVHCYGLEKVCLSETRECKKTQEDLPAIKKRISTEPFVDRMAALYIGDSDQSCDQRG